MNRSLGAFAKKQCANWDNHYRVCALDDDKCHILHGEACEYFQKSVLGPPDYPYRVPGFDYEKLYELYAKLNPKFAGSVVEVRRCPDCNEVLEPRRRYCKKCARKRDRESRRESSRRRRENRGSNVVS